MELTGKTIVITGASSGLGRGLALALSTRSNRLVVTARRGELLETLAAEIRANGSQALVRVNDATDSADCQRVVDETVTHFGPIDLAVLNVGGSPGVVMGETSVDTVLGLMRLNYDSLVNYLVPLIAVMRDRGGNIAHTSSPAGMFGLPKSGPYSAAKAAGRLLLDTCRIELAHTPLRFVSLYPGFTATEGLKTEEVPSPRLIISKDRAVKEMLWAIERERSHHIFPKRIAWPIRLGRMLPEPMRRWVLQRAVPAAPSRTR